MKRADGPLVILTFHFTIPLITKGAFVALLPILYIQDGGLRFVAPMIITSGNFRQRRKRPFFKRLDSN